LLSILVLFAEIESCPVDSFACGGGVDDRRYKSVGSSEISIFPVARFKLMADS
jgi:hypothetical protein